MFKNYQNRYPKLASTKHASKLYIKLNRYLQICCQYKTKWYIILQELYNKTADLKGSRKANTTM